MFEEVREALKVHRRKPAVQDAPYDMLHNQLGSGSIVAFAQKRNPYVMLGQIVSYEPVLSMNTMKQDAWTHVRILGGQRHTSVRASTLVLVTHDYNKVNPTLVDDLLTPHYAGLEDA